MASEKPEMSTEDLLKWLKQESDYLPAYKAKALAMLRACAKALRQGMVDAVENTGLHHTLTSADAEIDRLSNRVEELEAENAELKEELAGHRRGETYDDPREAGKA